MQRNVSSTGNDSFMMVADGVKSEVTLPTYVSGNYNQVLSDMTGGYHGSLPFPARLDHSHPLNVRTTGETGVTGQDVSLFVKPIGVTGKFGGSPYYARLDHEHKMPTGNGTYVSTNNWPLITGGSDTSTYSPFLYTNTWTRGETKVNNKACGFKCEILTRCFRPKLDPLEIDGVFDVFVFREFTFDENGLVKAVSEEKYAFVEINNRYDNM